MRLSSVGAAHRSLGALVMLGVLSACGGNSGPDGTVGPEGATLIGSWGVRVVIPPGALVERAPLSVQTAPEDAPPPPDGAESHGDVIGMTPHGQTFLLPVTVTIPFSENAGPDCRLISKVPDGDWSEVPGARTVGNTLVADVDHFSYFLVVGP